ncbi:MAG: hypothetical protein GY835_19480 [bacterium]|nr:hypothetical protein [bacterium]
MKSRTLRLLLTTAVLCGPRVMAHAGELSIPLAPPAITIDVAADNQVAFTTDAPAWLSRTGEPTVPWMSSIVLLPPDARMETVSVELVGAVYEWVAETGRVPPTPPRATWFEGQLKLLWPTDRTLLDGADMNIYGRDALWPDRSAVLIDTGSQRGWRLARVGVPLVLFNPVRNALQLLRGGELIVRYESDSARAPKGVQPDDIGERLVRELCINYAEQVSAYEPAATRVAPAYIIVTTNAIEVGSTVLVDFVTHQQLRGFTVQVVTETDYGSEQGEARVDNIRHWLETHYLADHIEYVLLVGDPRPSPPVWDPPNWAPDPQYSIPMKLLYPWSITPGFPLPSNCCQCWDGNTPGGPSGACSDGDVTKEECEVLCSSWDHWYFSLDCHCEGNNLCIGHVPHPSDYYYADLTGNWDLDGDGYAGEGEPRWPDGDADDAGPGGIDVHWEVLVGRIPFYGDFDDLDAILVKTIEYQNESATQAVWRENALLPMYNSDDHTPGYHLGEQIKDEILAPRGWAYHRVYENQYGLNPPPETFPWPLDDDVTDIWAGNPFGLVVWWTHGWGKEANHVIASWDVSELDDGYPSATFQASCGNSHPEFPDNLTYSLLKKGGVATIGATRSCYYAVGQTNFAGSGSSSGMAYEYASRIVPGQSAGLALHVLKQSVANVWWANWVVFNLYGDPSTRLAPPCPLRIIGNYLNPLTADDLVGTLMGSGATFQNATYTGAARAAGRFENGLTTVGLNDGVVLSSGDVYSAAGSGAPPCNTSDNISTDNGNPGHPGLNALIPGYTTNDAAILEFDVQCSDPDPDKQQINFRFVFSSDEYNEYVSSIYNDVFALWVDGQNVARAPYPYPGAPVAINNVNCSDPFSPPNGPNCWMYQNNDCDDLPAGGFPCAGWYAFEMDGKTIAVSVTHKLSSPGGWHHVELAIADAGDRVWDSNIFIEGGSFWCGKPRGCCCHSGRACVNNVFEGECAALGGYWGLGLSCNEIPCGEELGGACCNRYDGSCTFAMEDECVLNGGLFLGEASVCIGDFNGDGVDDGCPIREVAILAIPTVSGWGAIVMTLLLLLTALKVIQWRARTGKTERCQDRQN